MDDKLLVVYQLPMFFFVSPRNPELRALLERAFSEHYDKFLDFFNQHPLVKTSIERLKGRTLYRIRKNEALSEETASLPDRF